MIKMIYVKLFPNIPSTLYKCFFPEVCPRCGQNYTIGYCRDVSSTRMRSQSQTLTQAVAASQLGPRRHCLQP